MRDSPHPCVLLWNCNKRYTSLDEKARADMSIGFGTKKREGSFGLRCCCVVLIPSSLIQSPYARCAPRSVPAPAPVERLERGARHLLLPSGPVRELCACCTVTRPVRFTS